MKTRSDVLFELSKKLRKSENLYKGYAKGNVSLECLSDQLADRILNWFENEKIITKWEPEDEA